ncbi:MAG: tripartite tricarboxylate transporter substrate binding protein [Spirochaetales bacterium]|nr:tripartite tricarboxylate transporter substrate binding protein [Spirochaetales bacterium]
MKKLIVCALVALLAFGSLFAQGLQEETVSFPDPEKTITIVCPQGAGGGTDTQTRQLAEAMKAVSGFDNIIVENITGGSTGIGTNAVIDSEPDGYTLLMYGTYVICGTMTGYTDGFEKMDMVAGLDLEPFMIAVRRDSNFKSLKDVIEYAKANPGKVTLGNAGATATTGVVAYGLNVACDNIFNVVNFNGGAELIPAVLGGHCDVGIFSQSEVKANLDNLLPVAFLGDGHSVVAEFTEVPNLAEAGYPDLNVPGGCFRGITCAQGTPDDVKAWLADTIEKAFNTDSFQTWLKNNGILPQFTKLDEFEKFNADLVETMKPILKATGLAKGKYAE